MKTKHSTFYEHEEYNFVVVKDKENGYNLLIRDQAIYIGGIELFTKLYDLIKEVVEAK